MKAFDLVKEMNSKRVIKVIREKGPISRIDISEYTGIPQPTITRITDELLKENLIRETGSVPSSRGRRPVLLTFNHSCYYSMGVQLGRSSVHIALTDLNGNIVAEKIDQSLAKERIETVVGFVKEGITQLLQDAGIEPSLLLGVGIGIPGPINQSDDGRISPPNFYGASHIPLHAMFSEGNDFRIVIGSNSGVAALAEKWFGKGIGYQNFVYVTADIGIGSGMIVNGNLYRGLFGEAGGIGHFTIDYDGEKCTCGKYGCLETLVSIPRMEEKLRQRLKRATPEELALFRRDIEELDFDDIVRGSREGSAICRGLIEEAGCFLGIGVANLIDLINPELVIVGGRLGNSSDLLIDSIKSTIETRVLSIRGRKTPVVVSGLNSNVVLGAAALIINDTFSYFSSI